VAMLSSVFSIAVAFFISVTDEINTLSSKQCPKPCHILSQESYNVRVRIIGVFLRFLSPPGSFHAFWHIA